MPKVIHPIELWGGVECTVNRVGDVFFDQLEQSGHRRRCSGDLAMFAQLGLKTLRTSVHWEFFESTLAWDFFDHLVGTTHELGIRPILGLLHHGSGPKSTNLLDPQFPEKLASYALKVADRYPHILDYTPVNEPQTTGRFSCLYGHWYPHHRDMQSYTRALIHQMKGIVLSMRAIRSVQPNARLIHTEDGGVTFSTSKLESFRLEREHRRWLGVDLLCGAVTQQHPLFSFLKLHGVSEKEILWFAHNSCPPSILGLNYYVTSDRFLDHRMELYPPHFAGGDSGKEPLVDIEAVRVRSEGLAGASAILQEAWTRYRIPVAITEAHLGSEPEEQVMWLKEVWQGAQEAQQTGVDVRAVTVWALLGSYNWCHLCTQDAGAYEPGVFALKNGVPVQTELAALVTRLISDGALAVDDWPLLQGWWNQNSRLTVNPSSGAG